jgi:hypothetical protein
MFQFPRCPHPHLSRCLTVASDGLPHSDTPGSPVASSSPGLFAAWPRPSSAAGAKASTVRSSSWIIHHIPLHTPQHSTPIHSRFPTRSQIGPPAHACCCFVPQTTPFKKRMTVSGFLTQQKTCLDYTQIPSSRSPGDVRHRGPMQRTHSVFEIPHSPHQGGYPARFLCCVRRSGAAGTRTPDLRRARAALSQLSYDPICVVVRRSPLLPSGRAWTRTRDLGLIRTAL